MFVQVKRHKGAARALTYAACLCLCLCGCDGGVDSIFGGGSRSTLGASIIQDANDSPHYESNSNNAFRTAEFVDVEFDPRSIRGTITGSSDVDVYDLGPVAPGDRIVVEMTADTSLDGAIALFDESDASLLVNDHRNVYLGRTTPFIDVVIRNPSSACYVVASATPNYSARGDYSLLAYKESPVALPARHPNTILLAFDGDDNVRIGARSLIDVPPFNPASIDPVYSGWADEMIREIVAGVREDYRGLDVTILSTSEGAVYDRKMTRLYFGTFDAALLGVAEGVDEFNSDAVQEAIVFTDTFQAFMLIDPTVSEMAHAIANVASHEVGHLLGLVHTDDPLGVMDVTASLRDLLEDQEFRFSPLYADVFPIGSQDAVQKLLDTVGGDAALSVAKNFGGRSYRRLTDEERTGPPARTGFYLSGCGLDE